MNLTSKLRLAVIMLIAGVITASAEKPAILMVHFGTTVDETRAVTIDVLNADVAKAYPEMTVVEAYTSNTVRKRLRERGINKFSTREALIRLAASGADTVIVQPSTVLPGIEYDRLVDDVEYMKPFFKQINVGKPLLATVDDCMRLCDIIAENYHPQLEGKNGGVVFVGHGTRAAAGAIYSQLDYMLTAKGHRNATVMTIEGYPTTEDGVARMCEVKAKNVTLAPLMLVAGDHMLNDIAGEIADEFRESGFDVTPVARGLGEISAVRAMYIEHLRQAMK